MDRSLSASAPEVSYPSDLPISQRSAELLRAISDHQVVVVAGETGSGKSTQLPKMCLALGLHNSGWIGHTQPRRIAARSIAERVASELGDEVGGLVGFKVRFTDKVSPRTAIKAMTDGILLAEMQHDRLLSAYSTIIIDEAHERSLNIDFILGYLHNLLPKRPDLKVIITSATIDTERFSEHFNDAPVVEVSGRAYPVELRYRPLVEPETEDLIGQPEAIVAAVRELELEGPGDILVFASGEREIRETLDALADERLPNTELLGLYGRMSVAEQHRVFQPVSSGNRRVVVATNVAETSLTVPGIRYVIDPGTARISRYSNRTKVQRLPIEAVSQASANQRAGRCGRVAPGVCIRLYSVEDFESRPEFTEPEITRTNLASVILQMAALGLGDVESFPFVDPPELRNIRDGVALLEELNAVDPDVAGTKQWLTPIGRKLARLPVDPRLGRMVVEAAENGCLREVMIIAAAMSVQDPRERPRERSEEAGQLHARFTEPGSDFLTWLNLWDYLESVREALSNNQFRKLLKREFLSYNRVREWSDVYGQLQRTARSLRWPSNTAPASPDQIHQSLLTGLLSHVGLKDMTGNEYTGGRQSRFIFGRGSCLSKKPPKWVMAGELVETNRLWAHSGARIQPEWAERAGQHVIKRSYEEPRWDAVKGSAMTVERASLYGVPLVAGRRIHYRRVDPEVAREMFIHHALIEGDWETHHGFFSQNEGVLDEIRRLGARQRRNLMVEFEVLYNFFDQRIGESVTSGSEFDRWWNRRRKKSPGLLDLTLSEILDTSDVEVDDRAFPEVWQQGDFAFEVDYDFSTGGHGDGVTIVVPIGALEGLSTAQFEWNVPGLRHELITALLRSMPKAIRKAFLPIPMTVDAVFPALESGTGDLTTAVRRELIRYSGTELPADAVDLRRLPSHLRPMFHVVGASGEVLARGRNLEPIKLQLASEVRSVLTHANHALVTTGKRQWDFGDIPRAIDTEAAGQHVQAYPALVDEGKTVGLKLTPDVDTQFETMWRGTVRLLRLTIGGSARMLNELLTPAAAIGLTTSPQGSKVAWVDDAADCIFAHLVESGGGPAWTAEEFGELSQYVRSNLAEAVGHFGPHSVEILELAHGLRLDLGAVVPTKYHPAYQDMVTHLNRLVYPHHLSGVGAHRLADIVRYLRGIRYRLDKLPTRTRRDTQQMWKCRRLESDLELYMETLPHSAKLEALNWDLEEFRVASFAQILKAKQKVSEERLRAVMATL